MTGRVRIIFVDDEPHVLQGLRRLLVDWDEQWETVFCTNGRDALAELERRPAEVVVTDMRMPQMDGGELLDMVRQRSPATIRVILSGYAENKSVMKTVGPAHFYLAKPCDPDRLFAAIARPLALRSLLKAPELQSAIGKVANLPSLPRIFSEIREEIRSARGSPASVAALLAQDVAMTAEILKLTNSAFFGLGARISTVLQAVRVLGMEIVQTLVLEIGLFRQFGGDAATAPLFEALNRYSLNLGALAEKAALAAAWDDETAKAAHCAGMLSCIGALVLLDNFPGHGDAAPACAHQLVGAYLLGLWGFDDRVVEAVAFSAAPSRAPGNDNPLLTALHVAAALGPPAPFPLPDAGGGPAKLDMAYLIEARQDGNVRRWRELIADHLDGECDG